MHGLKHAFDWRGRFVTGYRNYPNETFELRNITKKLERTP